MEQIRAQGYAVDNEENAEGIRCFAVALEIQSPPQDAMSATIPLIRLDPDREATVVELLTQAQQRMRPQSRSERARTSASESGARQVRTRIRSRFEGLSGLIRHRPARSAGDRGGGP